MLIQDPTGWLLCHLLPPCWHSQPAAVEQQPACSQQCAAGGLGPITAEPDAVAAVEPTEGLGLHTSSWRWLCVALHRAEQNSQQNETGTQKETAGVKYNVLLSLEQKSF